MSDYEKLTDNQLIDLVFQRLNTVIHPLYMDDNYARYVRNRIEASGLIREYRHCLATQVWPEGTPSEQFKGPWEFAFRFEQATCRQQCIAALMALEARK